MRDFSNPHQRKQKQHMHCQQGCATDCTMWHVPLCPTHPAVHCTYPPSAFLRRLCHTGVISNGSSRRYTWRRTNISWTVKISWYIKKGCHRFPSLSQRLENSKHANSTPVYFEWDDDSGCQSSQAKLLLVVIIAYCVDVRERERDTDTNHDPHHTSVAANQPGLTICKYVWVKHVVYEPSMSHATFCSIQIYKSSILDAFPSVFMRLLRVCVSVCITLRRPYVVSCCQQISNSGITASVWLRERKTRHVKCVRVFVCGTGVRLVFDRWEWEEFPRLSVLLRGLRHAQTFRDDSSVLVCTDRVLLWVFIHGEEWRDSSGSVPWVAQWGGGSTHSLLWGIPQFPLHTHVHVIHVVFLSKSPKCNSARRANKTYFSWLHRLTSFLTRSGLWMKYINTLLYKYFSLTSCTT